MNIKFGSFIVKEKCQTGAASMFVRPGLVLDQGGAEPLCVSSLRDKSRPFSSRKGSWRNGQATRSWVFLGLRGT